MINFYFSIFLYFPYFTTFSWFMCNNGMLRHSLATLEGCNLLWHIVAPPPPSTPLSFKMFEPSFKQQKVGSGILQLPQSILILKMRSLFEENPLWKIMGSPWKEGEIRLEVDKAYFCSSFYHFLLPGPLCCSRLFHFFPYFSIFLSHLILRWIFSVWFFLNVSIHVTETGLRGNGLLED